LCGRATRLRRTDRGVARKARGLGHPVAKFASRTGLDYVHPQEGEGAYYAHTEASQRRRINNEAAIKPRRLIQECPMIKVFGYLKRKPGLSPQEFAEYYEHNHVPLVLSKAFMPMVYKRNYIQRGDAFNIEGNEISFDCMTELVFAGRDDLSVWMASLGIDEIARDEENFIDRAATRAYVVDERSSAG
jgi:uncharacterized protein (TIGR02118 family)